MTTLERPLLRGVSHQVAFFVSLAAGVVLVASAQSFRATVAAAVFAATVAGMFGASTLYHRVRWGPRASAWMRRVDHAGIYLVIGGSYTPYTLIVLSGVTQMVVLALVWAGVATAIAIRFAWVTAPRWLAAGLGLGLGWVSVIALPQLIERVEPAGLLLLVIGGVLYTVGAIVYGLRRPDPVPAVFGFHEVFHLLVVAAVACQYASIAFFVISAG
jgi:hemolysin III